MPKPNKLALTLILAIGGLSVFSAYSSLNNHFLPSSLVILPFQVGVSLYWVYLYWRGQLKGTSRYQKQRPDQKS
ncbi:MAG: hypothetical protein WCA35_30895 [Kovacikia sp.]